MRSTSGRIVKHSRPLLGFVRACKGSSLLGFCWPALRVGPPPWIHMSAVSFRTSTSCDPHPRSLFCLPPASPVLASRPYPRGVLRRALTIQHNRQAGAGEAEGPGTVCPFQESMDRWLRDVVVDLKLCPWASPALQAQAIQVIVHRGAELEGLLDTLLTEARRLKALPEEASATTLLGVPHALQDFDDFLDFVALVEECFEELELEGYVQLAHFHPDYTFAGTSKDDVTNYTNRAPIPVLHLLREAEVSRAVEQYDGQTERIYERNQQLMETMGPAKLRELLASVEPKTPTSGGAKDEEGTK